MPLLLALSAPALAATLSVDPTGSNGYSSIQSAIDAASSGDTIAVAAGTYLECIDLSGKELRVVGAGASSTILDGDGCSVVIRIDSGEPSGTSVSDLTVTNGDHGAWVAYSDAEFDNMVFDALGSATTYGSALYLRSATVTVTNSELTNNTAQLGTIYTYLRNDLTVTDSLFVGNQAE